MSEIHVHIERLIVDGVDRASMDLAVLHAAISSAVRRELALAADAHAGGAPPSSGDHPTLRAPSFRATRDVAVFGHRAGGALASAIAPVCVGGATR
jgi:hypothetical protein